MISIPDTSRYAISITALKMNAGFYHTWTSDGRFHIAACCCLLFYNPDFSPILSKYHQQLNPVFLDRPRSHPITYWAFWGTLFENISLRNWSQALSSSKVVDN
jgi:hypothetical protein